MSNTEGRFRDCARVEGRSQPEILAGTFQPTNHHPGITITPSTKTPPSQALPILEDLWFPSLF
jgi:hypothetical protein